MQEHRRKTSFKAKKRLRMQKQMEEAFAGGLQSRHAIAAPPQTCSSLTQPVNTDDSAKQFTEHLLFTYTYKNRAIFLCVKDVGDVCGFQNDDCFGVWGRQPRISGVNQNKRADGNTRCRPNKQRESERRDTSSTEGDAKTMWKKGNDKDTWTMVQLLRYMRPSVLLTIA
ncbi:uncharacterized protein MONOS_11698 [Monocercomonoides exilis]|uniref:uncharacterized protein n=1 Tax=Monocercomonoides exilis TaxID=2049356 RepID=UPI0035597F5D|nr:hypothetical protein MONOS_11698 [Monocercomonoides exilis]|eukprot:MONOS_11698.1-p1 / transcript=MONOS_11698.1 / gene=MONOS_11698 / organism=Monocercomonoides_exilis_PA203 / gene_product=unspecified product / transcript_product=unspecified product / location=Mono_scaffold00603:5324-5830(+) / protein_length=169 / sequence_SO=supercontig / SO=protein_coding / is_pseudo=false